MSTRHEAREWAVQFLFQRDFNRGDLAAGLEDFWASCEATSKARDFAEELIQGVEDHRRELDDMLQRYAEHWDVQRMGALDRNVMRVAVYEMLHRPDIPPVVSINEAVQIAKEFSSLESGRFVNGLLDQICRHIDRPARSATDGGSPDSRKDIPHG
jgi:N utilization substance protein B